MVIDEIRADFAAIESEIENGPFCQVKRRRFEPTWPLGMISPDRWHSMK